MVHIAIKTRVYYRFYLLFDILHIPERLSAVVKTRAVFLFLCKPIDLI